MTVSPAIAKPAINIQHLHVNNTFTSSLAGNNSLSATSDISNNISNKILTQYDTSFSTGLILSNPITLSESKTEMAMTVVNQSNDFFARTMIISDKINQFISSFTSPTKEGFSEEIKASSKSKVMRKKCSSNSPSYS
jgi:hypothetical protein